MEKILYFFLILFVFSIVSVNFVRNASSNGVNAQDTMSEEYIIKNGDTLWDISKSKLEDSFLWPKLWKENPQIKNPDLIYPGDKIIIPSKKIIIPMVEAPKEPLMEEVPVVTKPKILEEKPAVEVLKEVPRKYILNKNLYITSGWISGEFPSIGQITAAPDNRSIFGKNDLVYLKTNENASVGDKFFAIRDIKEVKHPKTKASLGHLVRIPGILEVIKINNGMPKAKVIASFEELQLGDGLLPYKEIEPPIIPDPDTIRTPDIRGYIVESHMNTVLTSTGDIVYLDKGENDGLKVGDVFPVFSETPVKNPIGTIQVLALQPTTSKAIISKSSQEITIGDMWGNK